MRIFQIYNMDVARILFMRDGKLTAETFESGRGEG